MEQGPDKIAIERIPNEPGTGERFMLLIFTKATHQLLRKYGGDPVSPLYGPQGPAASRART